MASTADRNTPTKRACDSCHRRKIKCINGDGSMCRSCASTGLVCTYNSIPQKKGPKGHRAKVLNELRNEQLNAKDPESSQGLRSSILLSHHRPSLLTPALLGQCVNFFYSNIFPSQPVLGRQHIDEAIMTTSWSVEAHCMILALCAFTLIQRDTEPSFSLLETSETRHTGLALLEASRRSRKDHDFLPDPTYQAVLTSWFYYRCCLDLGKSNTAWYYLREATTLAQLLGMHDEGTYRLSPHFAAQKRVLFWLLFIAERQYDVQFDRPMTLRVTTRSPSPLEVCPDQLVKVGLARTAALHKGIDETCVDVTSWVCKIRMDLLQAVSSYLPCTEGEAVKIQVTQHWLRAVYWQLCSSRGLISSLTGDAVQFLSPMRIAEDLEAALETFSRFALDVHGEVVAKQVFDVACCLIDAVAHESFLQDVDIFSQQECMSRMLTHVQFLHGGEFRYPQLITKLQKALPQSRSPWSFGPNCPVPLSGSDASSGNSAHPGANLHSNGSLYGSNSAQLLYHNTH